MRLALTALAALPLLAACSDLENFQLPTRGAALESQQVSPVQATFSGRATPTTNPTIARSADLLFVRVNGSVLRVAGVQNAALSDNRARDAVRDLETFLSQGPATCTTNTAGEATCSIGGFDLARFLKGRVYAL